MVLLLLEPADAGKILNLTSGAVRLLARAGHLPIAATTPRGSRLFRKEDVEAVRQKRQERRER